MALTSTLGSPGIEIREVDNSYRLDSSTATTVYIPGFTSQGPVDEVMSISSIADFETIYGIPTNAAERYFYYTVKAVLDNSGAGVTVLCSRLPYGSGAGDTVTNAYTVLAYPAIPVIKKTHDSQAPALTNGFYTYSSDEITVRVANLDTYKGQTVVVTSQNNSYEDLTVTVGDTTLSVLDIQQVKEEVEEEESTFIKTTYTLTYQSPKTRDIEVSFTIVTETREEEETIVSGLTSFEITESSLHKEAVSGTIDFDQMIFSCENTEFRNAFTVTKSDGSKLVPSSHEVIFVIDDDKEIDELVLNSVVGTDLSIPEIDRLVSFDVEKDALAPELRFEGGYTAKGLIGSEVLASAPTVISTTHVHLSYTLFDKAGNKCGSLYIKLTYNGDAIKCSFDTSNSLSLVAKYTEAYEIAASYQGQSVAQATAVPSVEKESQFATDVTYIIGSPVTYQISLNEYYKLITGETLKWKKTPYTFGNRTEPKSDTFGMIDTLGHSAFIVINTSRSIINNSFEGFYLGMTDNMFVNPSDDYIYDAVDSVKITTKFFDATENAKKGLIDMSSSLDNGEDVETGDFHTLNKNRLSFYLDSNYQGSISRVLTRNITSMDISSTEFDDTINMGLFKLSKSTTSSDILKLNYSLREKYNWSFGKSRLKSTATSTKPVSYFVENIIEGSNNLTILMNPYIAEKSFVDTDGVIHGKMRVYGNKLTQNLDKFESKYLLRNYTELYSNSNDKAKAVSAIVPARLAKSSINSWTSIISQAGVSPRVLKSIKEGELKAQYETFQPLNSIIPFGTYTEASNTNKIIGSLPTKLQRALELVENDEEYPDIDLVVEAGLGTIYSYSKGGEIVSESGADSLFADDAGNGKSLSDEESSKETVFDETIVLAGVEDLRTGRSSLSDEAQQFVENYRAIHAVFTNFADSMQNGGRGDTFFISDVPRGILIKGKNTKVTDLYGSTIENNAYDFGDTVNHSFSTSVYYPIKHTFDTIVSSYMSTYAQWVKVLDGFSSEKVWIPISGYVAGNMASTDAVYGPWYAAAGLRRGVISGVLDYALSPNVSQRTDLYKICINSVPKIPNYGVTIWGLRTMSKAASAFDQNTCRRTFLYMEKKVKQTLRYYIFEPNTSYTRLQIVNDLDPFLEKVKNAGGIYNYTLVCDTTNNTPDVINNGDLAVSIAAAPTRTAENIVVEFTANKYTEEVSSSESIS